MLKTLANLKVIFLGTSSAIPTSERGLSSIALVREGEILLFDAGEGTQRSFFKANLGFNKKMKIFISHLHGDHCVGLLGLLQTMSMLERTLPLSVYGPRGLLGFVKNNMKSLKCELSFPLNIKIVTEGTFLEEKEYVVRACKGKHFITNYAYALEEKDRPGVFEPNNAIRLGIPKIKWSNLQKDETVTVKGKKIKPEQVIGPKRRGRKIVISGDTRPTLKLKHFLEGSDVAILDSTYFDEHKEKAKEHMHMTASEAMELSSKSGVKKVVLTHFSSRYRDVATILASISKKHINTIEATDFMEINIPYPDELTEKKKE